jgi:hypothetical protein
MLLLLLTESMNGHYRRAVTETDDGEPSPYLIPLSIDGREVLSVDMSSHNRGWAAYFSSTIMDSGALVLVQMAPEMPLLAGPSAAQPGPTGVALEVKEVRVTAGLRAGGFASSLLREIPILRIEAAINQTAHRQVLADRMSDYPPTADLPGGARFRILPTKPNTMDRRSLAIADPGGYRKPDEFYRQVADLFLYQAAVSARPAHDIAEANGIPVATVHRWIREAKARKVLLLPVHRGGGDSRDR